MEIKFVNVSKKIGKNLVVDNIDLVVRPKQVVGLQGINGSGKTMIMRLMAGLIYATSGEISVDGKILGRDMRFPPNTGLMLENPAFLGGYDGYDNLRILADVRSVIKEERIREVMEIVGLKENGKKKYRKFSLGMKQRLGIAAAFMEYPDLLLLDEPTNSLDESGVEMVRRVVKAEKERGAAVVVSCHDAGILRSMADEIIELRGGRIADIRSVKEGEVIV